MDFASNVSLLFQVKTLKLNEKKATEKHDTSLTFTLILSKIKKQRGTYMYTCIILQEGYIINFSPEHLRHSDINVTYCWSAI